MRPRMFPFLDRPAFGRDALKLFVKIVKPDERATSRPLNRSDFFELINVQPGHRSRQNDARCVG
jgi:hypothetical protein